MTETNLLVPEIVPKDWVLFDQLRKVKVLNGNNLNSGTLQPSSFERIIAVMLDLSDSQVLKHFAGDGKVPNFAVESVLLVALNGGDWHSVFVGVLNYLAILPAEHRLKLEHLAVYSVATALLL